MRFEVLSLFPDYFKGPLDESMIKRAREKGIIEVNLVNIRSFSKERHSRVDDRPFGGGPGMVMMAEPVVDAIRSVKRENSKVVYLSPQGKKLDHSLCRKLAEYEHLILLCGHYEGIDERAIESEVDLEISIGDYVLTNGALAACVVIDAVSRFVDGVIGDSRGKEEDSFESSLLDWPHYTKPVDFEGRKIPEVLLTGHHENIAKWRKEQAVARTFERRKDLYLSFLEKMPMQESALSTVVLRAVSIKVDDIAATFAFYKKVFGKNTLLDGEKIYLTMCNEVVSFTTKETLFFLDVEQEDYLQLKAKAKRASKIQEEGEVRFSFIDPNGYTWVIANK